LRTSLISQVIEDRGAAGREVCRPVFILEPK
jgi:hypothetical protein